VSIEDRAGLLARLHELLQVECGLDLDRGGTRSALAEHVAARLALLECGEQHWFDRVLANLDGEREGLIHAATVRHTWFFRDPEQLAELSDWLRKLQLGRTLDVWIAGCATGEEAWTVAMIACELGMPVRVLATDVDALAIAEARLARYDEDRLRELPPTMLRHLRRAADGRWHVDVEGLVERRCRVEFAVHNLCHLPPEPAFDVICCRNVLIYLELERIGPILDQLRSRVRPHGTLVLGGADRLTDPQTWRATLPTNAAATRIAAPPRSDVVVARAQPRPDSQATMMQSSLAIASGRVDEALALLESVVADEALQAETQFWIGLAHHHAGRADLAIAAFRRANCLTPELWPASLFAALAHERRGNHRAALRCWTTLSRTLERARSPLTGSDALVAALPTWQSEALALARLRSSRTLELQSNRPPGRE
jgi:chemotaxis methyl-accepting protein methylase